MSVTILPFSAEHVESAASLLAARHRHDRCWAPDLSAEYENPAATMPIVHDLFSTEGTDGVVALNGASVVGYLLGATSLGSPTGLLAGFMHPRAAEIGYAGHAVNRDDGAALYQRLYAALAQQWVINDLVGHYIIAPANSDTIETWWDLGFSRFLALGIRSTAPPDEREDCFANDIEVRRATTDDEEAVQALTTELFRTFASPPIFVPFLPETTAARQRLVTDHLADPASSFWLAYVGDRLVGMQMFEEPHSSHWHQSTLQAPPRAVYLFLAYTVPEARSTGVGAALFARTMAWAREAGYDSCLVHFLTASRAATFWRDLGFHPASYRLCRHVDERTTWAGGGT